MRMSADGKRFDAGMTVGEAFDLHPDARWVLSSLQIGACAHCAVSTEQTIGHVAEEFGVPVDRVISELNALLTR